MTTRILLLASSHSYRSESFFEAARRLGVDVVLGVDVPPAHIHTAEDRLGLDFRDATRSVRRVREYARTRPVHAVLATDDATVTLAAHLNAALGLRQNSIESAETARDKRLMRGALARAGLPCPWFNIYSIEDDAMRIAARIEYPCVLKPTCLSGSRGVMRANDRAEFEAAFTRLKALLLRLDQREFLVEGYLPGAEFALEGLLDDGRLHVLALFDKPDPLEGPFFEETIYTTPSRFPVETQADIAACAQAAAWALGLHEGPVHAEMRVNAGGVWLLEIAGRSIGGLCSQTLHFAQSADVSLEELIIRQALGLELEPFLQREGRAGGVMMIPIPGAGLLTSVNGLDEARAVPGIESIEITAPLNYPVAPLPEGESYLGFIFARGETAEDVEAALRAAHACLRFEIAPELPLENFNRAGPAIHPHPVARP
jgi:biotin carboxylase